jgi:predicted RNase H-like nuclease (RuvC/YqgF family)
MSQSEADTIKEEIYNQCLAILNTKEQEFKAEIANLRDGIANDSKSSMGDKYETSREMMQQEINRLEQQLAANRQQIFNLKAVPLYSKNERIIAGDIVNTSIGSFFISISLGEIKIKNQAVFVISPASPLGKLLIGKKKGDQFEMNKNKIEILNLH